MTVAETTPRSINDISPNMSPPANCATESVPPPGGAPDAPSLPERIRHAEAGRTSKPRGALALFPLASAGPAPRAAYTSVARVAPEGDKEGDVRPPMHARTLTEALEYHVEKQGDRLTVFLYEEDKET